MAKKSKDISNQTMSWLLIATIVVSLGATFLTLSSVNDKLVQLGFTPITGLALAPNATATLTISTTSSIKWVSGNDAIAWTSGSVDTSGGSRNCTLSTIPEYTNTGCQNFAEIDDGLLIENDGNTNLSVELQANVTAGQFIGGTIPKFLWNVSVNETGSCKNVSSDVPVYPNTTSDCSNGEPVPSCGSILEPVATSYKVVCPRLEFHNDRDELSVDINVSIPEDAPPGAKLAGITVRGTRSPLS